MPIPKAFWTEEAHEPAHKRIKNALLAAGETPHGKHNQKKKKSTPKKNHKVAGKGKIAKIMHEFKHGSLHSGSKKGPKVTNPKEAIAIAISEKKKAGKKK